jgi:hypothetical protein
MRIASALLLALVAAANAASGAEPSGAFEKVHCLKYAEVTGKLSMLIAGAKPDPEMEHPMLVCVAQRDGQTLVLDAGFSDQAYGAQWGVTTFSDLAERLGDVGVKAEDVDVVTLGTCTGITPAAPAASRTRASWCSAASSSSPR